MNRSKRLNRLTHPRGAGGAPAEAYFCQVRFL